MGTMISPLGSGGQADLMATCALPIPRETKDKKSTPASNRVKPISCLAFSPDGHYLAAGEMGHQPRILIWDVKERVLLHQCRAHKFGILSVAFSPNMRYLVSVGFQHDGYLYVWNWRKGNKLASNRVTSKVNALSFSKDGSYFVTAGLRHVKYWYFDAKGRLPKRGNLASRETQVLDGRSGILGALRDCNFVDVACDHLNSGCVYFITDSGILCVFKENRGIDKWVNLQVSNAYSITVSSTYVICSSSHGTVRLFEPVTLKYYGVLPKPHPLGMDISAITSPEMLPQENEQDVYYPDAVAQTYDESTAKLTIIYSDRSLYIWDVTNMNKIGKYRSFIAHSDCVWGIEPCPINEYDNTQDTRLPPTPEATSYIPPNSFATFSADGTVRFWNLDHTQPSHSCSTSSPLGSPSSYPSPEILGGISMTPSPSSDTIVSSNSSTSLSVLRRNIYSRELIKMLYVDSDAAEFSKLRRDVDLTEEQCPDFGIRSLKMNKNKLMATGDRNGNLRVHDMDSWEQITYQEAHDSEILSIDISNPANEDAPNLIATASRDRLLHIFDIQQNYRLVQSLDDHSSSITSVRFTKNGEKLISCGADKGLIFRQHTATSDKTSLPTTNTINVGESNGVSNSSSNAIYSNYHNHSGRSTVFDMTLDITNRFAATVTGERRLFVFNVESGKPFRMCKPETPEEIATGASFENSGGSLINIDLDPLSGTFAVTSGSDRCLRLFDLVSGVCVDKVCAHAELITSVKFVRAPKESLRIISTCSDGTIFIWSVGKELIAKMKARLVDPGNKSVAKLADDGNLNKVTPPSPHRLRRVSTASMVRPTPTLSQMIRQGERKTFSTVSPAEHKYDELYKKVSGNRKQRDPTAYSNGAISTAQSSIQSINTNTNTNGSDGIPSPLTASPVGLNRHTPLADRSKNNAGNIRYKDQQQQNHHISPNDRKPVDVVPQGKLERLYNGIPTTGARDRATNMASHRHQQPLAYNPMIGQRMNPVLRKQMSREALTKKDSKDNIKSRPKSNETSTRKSSASSSAEEPRRKSDIGTAATSLETSAAHSTDERYMDTNTNGGHDDRSSSGDAITNGTTANGTKAAQHDGDDNDNEDGNENSDHDGNELDDDEDDDGDDDDEEDIIFITPPTDLDDIGKPIEVSANDLGSASSSSSSSSRGDETDGRKSPTSDNDVADEGEHHTNSEEEDSEENTDEAMIKAITSREAPRMTTSLSRTTSSTMISPRKKADDQMALEYQKLQQEKRYSHHDDSNSSDMGTSSSLPSSINEALENSSHTGLRNGRYNGEDENTNGTNSTAMTTTTPNSKNDSSLKIAKDTAALRKLHKKLEKSKKRQSFTARFLSSISDKKDQCRGSLDNVLNSFKDFNKTHHANSTNNMQSPTTISVASPMTPTTAVLSSSTQDLNEITPHIPPTPKDLPPLPTEPISPKEQQQQPSPPPDDTDSVDMENILSDLDGAKILLDSVLVAYSTLLKKMPPTPTQNHHPSIVLDQVEKKLRGMADSVNHVLGEENSAIQTKSQQDPATLAMLDKYSSLLVSIIESKLHT
ncbi:unnamed protein product [Absidia cylindrospora]